MNFIEIHYTHLYHPYTSHIRSNAYGTHTKKQIISLCVITLVSHRYDVHRTDAAYIIVVYQIEGLNFSLDGWNIKS